MSSEPRWVFPQDNTLDFEGMSSDRLETKSSKIDTLAKEICQNSLDARRFDDRPVIVEFDSFEINRESFPDFIGYSKNISKCRAYADSYFVNDRRAVRVLEEMEKLLRSKKISILRISDFNTTGLVGSESPKKSNKWSNLMGMGISDKTEDSGGSHGVGKRATYEMSSLKTVIYSTLDEFGKEASTGVCKLMSFEDGGFMRKAKGRYCKDDVGEPIYGQLHLDENHERKESGTDIYIPAFADYSESWTSKVKLAVVSSFFVAILRGDLIVKIKDYKIDRDSIAEVLDDLPKSFYEDQEEYIEDTKALINSCRTSPVYQGSDYTLHLVQNPSIKKVMGVRGNGMAIQEIKNINGSFVGVIIINDREKNRILRSAETPTHNSWNYDMPDLQEDKEKARKEINAVKNFVKTTVATMMQNELGDSEDAYGLGDYLSLDENGDMNKDPPSRHKSQNSKITDITEINPKRKKKVATGSQMETVTPSEGSDESDYADRVNDDDDCARMAPPNPPQPCAGDNPNAGLKPEPDGKLKKVVPGNKIKLEETRTLKSNRDPNEYALHFTCSESAEFFIRIRAAGVENDREKEDEIIRIIYAHNSDGDIPCENNMIGPITAEKGVRCKISFVADYPILFSPYPEVL